MGVHYVNANYLKDEVPDIEWPQAVMYEPAPDGKMALIAVETSPSRVPPAGRPALQLHRRAQPLRPRPVLRTACVAWKANPRGPFADMNPNVSCAHAGHGK
jgi:hypothetical protein